MSGNFGAAKESRFYFQLVEHAMIGREAAKMCYRDPDTATTGQFCSINGIKDADTLYPGHFLVVPSLERSTVRDPLMSSVTERVNHSIRHSVTPTDARNFNDDFALLQHIARDQTTISVVGDLFDGVGSYMEQRLDRISADFKSLESVYRRALASGMKLNAGPVLQERRVLEQRLQAQLTGISRPAILTNPNARSIKDALAISHKSLQRSAVVGDDTIRVGKIATALEKTAKLSERVKGLAAVGTVLSIGESAATVVESYRKSGALDAVRTVGREASGLAAGRIAGTVGAELGAMAGTAVAVFFGVGTGGVGFVLMGLGAVGVGLIAGKIGTEGGKAAYDRAAIVLDRGAEQSVNFFMR